MSEVECIDIKQEPVDSLDEWQRQRHLPVACYEENLSVFEAYNDPNLQPVVVMKRLAETQLLEWNVNCEVETCIKEENEEEFIQLSTEYNPCEGKDGKIFVSQLQCEPPCTSHMAQSFHVKNILSNDNFKPNRHAIVVESDHSIGASVEQSITSSINVQHDRGEVLESTNHTVDRNERGSTSVVTTTSEGFYRTDAGENTTNVVNTEHVVGTSTSQRLNGSDRGESTQRKIPGSDCRTVKPYHCTVCGWRFSTPSYLNEHMRVHTGEKPYSCSFCDMKFRVQYALKMHELGHKGELPQCQVCGGRFVSLQKHMLTHSTNYKYSCSVCKKAFHIQGNLKKHMMSHTDERPITCQDCGGRFRTTTHLKTHMLTHTKERNYACHVCGKMFLQRTAVNTHMRMHSEDKPYECETCGRKFRQRSTLTVHQATHSSDRPFVCTTCGKAFKVQTRLLRHSMIHSGVQPYECSVCGMKFNQSCSVQRHVLTHTGEKPYVCNDCGLRFTQSGGLCSHRRLHCPARKTQPSTMCGV